MVYCHGSGITVAILFYLHHFWAHGGVGLWRMRSGLGIFLGGVFGFDEGVGALDEGVDLGVGDVAVEVELYPVSKALIERVAHR